MRVSLVFSNYHEENVINLTVGEMLKKINEWLKIQRERSQQPDFGCVFRFKKNKRDGIVTVHFTHEPNLATEKGLFVTQFTGYPDGADPSTYCSVLAHRLENLLLVSWVAQGMQITKSIEDVDKGFVRIEFLFSYI